MFKTAATEFNFLSLTKFYSYPRFACIICGSDIATESYEYEFINGVLKHIEGKCKTDEFRYATGNSIKESSSKVILATVQRLSSTAYETQDQGEVLKSMVAELMETNHKEIPGT